MSSHPSHYEAFARYGSGVTLVAVRSGDHDHFFIAASVLTASVNPFTLAISIGQDRAALPAITSGAPWAVSVLTNAHLPLVKQLTGPTTQQQRLAALTSAGAKPSPSGALWLPDALATYWCTTNSTTKVHDQVLVIGDVIQAVSSAEAQPLMRWNRNFHTTTEITSV
ncbi:flavin reductase family protein [Arthrobacter sp. B1805]|uniref:flavin reductase family protein n=1 Tax=Arthrobacter sp. B1805 TaxID=2058892 RepID=UPI000CE3E68E|nr:flavin reductase family protein [Arthrobacter sp. B1805]